MEVTFTQHNTYLLTIVVVVVIVKVVVMVVVVTILNNIIISSNSQLTAFALCAFRHRAPVSTPLSWGTHLVWVMPVFGTAQTWEENTKTK